MSAGAAKRPTGPAVCSAREPVVDESDEALMLQAGAGSHDACHELVRRYLGRIVAFAGRSLGDRTEAEDVAQEVFERLWIHAQKWHSGRASLATWLHRIALNLCLDRLARKREQSLVDVVEPVDSKPSMTALMQQEDIGRLVNRELAALPDRQKIAITLCHYQDLRNTEAAEIMGVSIEALESLLARGRRTLGSRLRGLVPDLLGES
jgi:RNA polymerase sigma-70 factor (ECF subfamily)